MSWLVQKLDVFVAAVVVAAAATFASQGQTFAAQYLKHAESELAEAHAHLDDVQNGLRFRTMGDQVRGELETEAKANLTRLERAATSARNTNLVLRPLVLARSGDPALIQATRRDFVPALPNKAGAIVFTVIGMLIGFAIYEAIKLPLVALAREPRRRKFRKRG